MINAEFRGRELLIRAIDDAVALGDAEALTRSLSHALTHLIQNDLVELPECVHQPAEGHYARRELYRSAQHGYTVIAMTWAPGQGTPIHDHDGMWGVEGVWHGQIRVDQYDLVERDGERYRFQPAGCVHGQVGSAGSIIPPHEYHAICNPSDSECAVSVHIYQYPMVRCGVFAREHDDSDWYRYSEKPLCLDDQA